MLRYVLIALVALLVPREGWAQSCDATISPGTDLSTAIAARTGGQTLCLNDGSYSDTVSSINKSPRVTIRSTNPRGATIDLTIFNSSGLTFTSVDWVDITVSGTVSELTFSDGNVSGCLDHNTTDLVGNDGILYDDLDFIDNIGCTKEGRAAIYCPSCGAFGGPVNVGVQISNSLFKNTDACSDNVSGETDGVETGTRGLYIGPGNIFEGIKQGTCDRHIDSIQGYGQGFTIIDGNFFINNEIDIGYYDGGSTETITNNVIVKGPTGINHANNVFLSIGADGTVTHNTLVDVQIGVGAKAADDPVSDLLFQDNVHVNADLYVYTGEGNGGCVGCVYNNNLRDAASSSGQSQTNGISGSADFIGGASGTTYAEYELDAGSPGENAAADPAGDDVGPDFGESEPPATSGTRPPFLIRP